MSWTPDLPDDQEADANGIGERDRDDDPTGRAESTKAKYKNSIDASIEHNNSISHLVGKTPN